MGESGVQVIDRVFDILELLTTEEAGLGITEIARRLNLNKSTAHRIVNGIMHRGYIEKTEQGLYRLGLGFVALSSLRLNNVELTIEAKPYLKDMTNHTGQTSHLAVLNGSDAMYIDKVETVKNLRLYSEIGKRIPVYCSGLGKSLVMDRADEEIHTLLKDCEYVKKTNKTLTSAEAVMKDIRRGRIIGWTMDDEEHDLGIRCFAAPVYDYTGRIVAAISTSGPSHIYTKDRDNEIGEYIVNVAYQISRRLGYMKK